MTIEGDRARIAEIESSWNSDGKTYRVSFEDIQWPLSRLSKALDVAEAAKAATIEWNRPPVSALEELLVIAIRAYEEEK